MKGTSFTAAYLLAGAVLAASFTAAQAQTTLYVNDEWGSAPAKSADTFPYEDRPETRFYLNVQNGKFYSSNFKEINADGTVSATDGPAEGPAGDELSNGIDYVLTGAEEKQYWDTSGITYQGLSVSDPITGYDDPTTEAVESLNLTFGTDAFATVRDAFLHISATPGQWDNTTIVVDSGIYFETIWIPRNNLNNTSANPYYGVQNDAFFDKFEVGLTIKGPRADKPVFTRGAYCQDETSQGMTFDSLAFEGIPGVNGTGEHPEGTYAATTGVSRQDLFEFGVEPNNKNNDPANFVGTVLADRAPGFREDFTVTFCRFDGLGIRVPFDDRSPVDASIPTYTTQPALNNIADAGGGRGGIELRGEYGTVTITDNTFRRTRAFATFDSEEANGNDTTWVNYIFDRNTLEDVWGSSAIRGQDPRQGARPTVGVYASVQNNTFRDLCVGAIQSYVEDASVTTPVQQAGFRPFDPATDTFADVDFIYDQRTQAGGFIKIFNIQAADIKNNSFINAAPTRDWFTKAVKVPPGHPDYLPMGAGMLIRDVADNPPTVTSDYQIIGNLFERVQQGVAVDQPGSLPYVPGGLMTGNTFIGCLSGFFNWNAVFYDFSMDITGNIFAEPSLDPLGIGVAPGDTYDDQTLGGIVFAAGAGVDEATSNTFTLDFTDNFFQDDNGQSDPDGPSGINNNSSAPDEATAAAITEANYEGDEAGEFEENFPVLDSDADGINDLAEADFLTDPNNPDSDGDGLSDGLELRIGTDPNDEFSPGGGDSDRDTIPDAVELVQGTDPNDPDSDNDGIRDDYEQLVGTNPNNAASVPSFGDATEDGTTDQVDAVAILQAFLDIDVLNLTNQDRADINRDGKIDNVDAIILFNWFVGNIPYIPFP